MNIFLSYKGTATDCLWILLMLFKTSIQLYFLFFFWLSSMENKYWSQETWHNFLIILKIREPYM